MPQRLQWSDLQVFHAVVERGSLGAAAKALALNHSTVLRRIARLEDTLRVRLFDRLPTGYVATERGAALAATLGGVAEQIGAAEREVGNDNLQLAGSVRLTVPEVLMPLLLAPLAAVQAQHPALRIELLQADAFLDLARHEADLAIRGANTVPDSVIARPLGVLQTALYGAASRFPTADGAALDALPWIGHSAKLAHLDSARWIAANIPAERVVMRVDSLVALADAVAAGIGVGWVLRPLAATRGGLVALRPPEPEFATRIWLLGHPDLRRIARIRAVADALHGALVADPRLREG